MMTVSACLWLGLFPLLQGGTYSRITADKWAIMLSLTAVSSVCFYICSLGKKKKTPRSQFLCLPMLAAAGLALWIVLSCAFSPYGADHWLIGASSRREGLLSQLCYLGLFFMFAFSDVRRRPVVISAAAGVALFFIVVMLQRAGINALGLYPDTHTFENTPAFQGTIGNIDMDNGYLCLLAGLFFAEIAACFPRVFRAGSLRFRSGDVPAGSRGPFRVYLYPLTLLAALGLTLFLIITMGTDAGIVTLAALAVMVLLQYMPGKWRLPLLLILLVLILVVAWYWPGQSSAVWELHEALHGRMQLSFGSNRVAVWIYSLGLARERLWTGGGSDTFKPRFREYLKDLAPDGLRIPVSRNDLLPPPPSFGTYLEANGLAFIKPFFLEYLAQENPDVSASADNSRLPKDFDNPHNEYVAHLVNHGLPAMLLFMLLILASLFRRRRIPDALLSPRKPLPLSLWKAAAACYAVQAFFSFSVPLVAPMFWVTLGLCAGNRSEAEQ